MGVGERGAGGKIRGGGAVNALIAEEATCAAGDGFCGVRKRELGAEVLKRGLRRGGFAGGCDARDGRFFL